MDFAALFGAQDHGQGRTVLDRAGRVVALQLGQDHVAARLPGRAGNALQAHERRIADGLLDSGVGRSAHAADNNRPGSAEAV
ncbi:Uncharacterised protein [Bordetella pertussis]|nr:Uncharacterised protein [Bordetella pertussis]